MNVLAFDTCMAACSAALIRGDTERLCCRFAPMDRGHAETLFPMIEAVMQEAQLGFADLHRIAVTRGPGSFTGVRAGIAAARGFALACGAPVVVASSLEVMALGCRERLGEQGCGSGFLIAHDARRGELYVQRFSANAEPLSEPALATPGDAVGLADGFGLVAGSGAPLIAAEADRAGIRLRAALPDLLPDAAHMARLAIRRAPLDKPVSPLYLRAPDAKPQTDQRLARA
jgi:tRNA threonylcarbamoyladenosine biosynthesis protein TsaB